MENWQKDIVKSQSEQVDSLFKSISGDIHGYDNIIKARAGIYQNTPENRKLGRVGQKYGGKGKDEDKKYSVSNKDAKSRDSSPKKITDRILDAVKELKKESEDFYLDYKFYGVRFERRHDLDEGDILEPSKSNRERLDER